MDGRKGELAYVAPSERGWKSTDRGRQRCEQAAVWTHRDPADVVYAKVTRYALCRDRGTALDVAGSSGWPRSRIGKRERSDVQ